MDWNLPANFTKKESQQEGGGSGRGFRLRDKIHEFEKGDWENSEDEIDVDRGRDGRREGVAAEEEGDSELDFPGNIFSKVFSLLDFLRETELTFENLDQLPCRIQQKKKISKFLMGLVRRGL